MAAATTNLATYGRTAPPFANTSLIPITVTASTTAYATATGGLPIDLTIALTAGAPPSMAYINPSDVIGLVVLSLSTNKFLPGNLAVGTPTYTNLGSTTVRVNQTLLTCPATVRLWGGSAGSGLAFAEFADGNNSDSFTAYLVVARSGENV